MNRLENNLLILKMLIRYFKNSPDLRFIQGLWACNIVDREDRFHEESSVTLDKMSQRCDGKLLEEEFISTNELVQDIRKILKTDTIPNREDIIPMLVDKIKELEHKLEDCKDETKTVVILDDKVNDLKRDLKHKSETIERLMKEKSSIFTEFRDIIERLNESHEKILRKNFLTDAEKIILRMLVDKICGDVND